MGHHKTWQYGPSVCTWFHQHPTSVNNSEKIAMRVNDALLPAELKYHI
jgi:hypothetical protein